MKELADFLSTQFDVKIKSDAKGLSFESEQPPEMKAALMSIQDAVKYMKHLTAVLAGGKRFVLMNRLSVDQPWERMKPDFDVCNDAIIEAAKLSKDNANGEIQVYDARSGREMIYFPQGGMN